MNGEKKDVSGAVTQGMPEMFPSGESFGGPLGQPMQKKKKELIDPQVSSFNSELNNQSTRLRVLEERYITLRKKMQATEQNVIVNYKRISSQVKAAADKLGELRQQINDLKGKIDLLQKEIGECADKQEFKVLQKYIELWDPTQFVTREEAKRIIGEALKQQQS